MAEHRSTKPAPPSGSSPGRGSLSQRSRITTDHDEIRAWVEERGGHPATVKGTGDAEETGILQIDLPGYSGEEKLEPISWEEFFKKFEENGLAFLYEQETAGGAQSLFHKLVRQEEQRRKAS